MNSLESKKASLGLYETVIKGGYCVGCGACASLNDSPFKIKLDEFSRLQAYVENPNALKNIDESFEKVCPFSDLSVNEDVLGKELFGGYSEFHNKIGYSISTYAGYVEEDQFRDMGSSGGMGTWIAYTLFNKGLVDGIIHVHQRTPTPNDPRLFHYQLSTTTEQVLSGSKSRYYPIELSEVVSMIRQRAGNYAIVGIPCFIKSIRLLTKQDALLKERIKFCIGLVCGHIKSTRFAEMLAWETGIKPSELLAIDFRTKLEGYGANQYGVTVKGLVNNQVIEKVSKPVNEMYGTTWGYGFFKYKSCDFCDDVVAETADVTVGDAWLPQYVNDSKGTNVVIVRNSLIDEIIKNAIKENRLVMDIISKDDVVRSQRAGFEHRRESLAYRLFLTDQEGVWRPTKRFKADDSLVDEKTKKRQILRVIMARESHIAFNKAIAVDSFAMFKKLMNVILKEYLKLYKGPFHLRVYNKLKAISIRILKRK